MKFNPFPIPDVSSYHSFLFDSYLLILFLLLLSNTKTLSLSLSLSLSHQILFPIQNLKNLVSMGEKVTIMILKVDLQCPCCYKKVKKILCKFPQIRDRMFNEKANTVTITVVCCNPEKIRDKLCCKGCKVIKSIEIVDPPKPKPKEPEKPKPKELEKPKPKEPEKPVEKPAPPPPKPELPKQPAPTPPPPVPIPQPVQPCECHCRPVYPARTCCGPCSEGYGGGPCYFGFGVAPPPPPPPPCYGGYGGYGYHDRPCHVTRCDYYFNEENSQSCSIM